MTEPNLAGSRVLVLGDGEPTQQARRLLHSAGAELKQRFDAAVTFVVVDRTVPADDHRVTRAMAASIPVLTTGQLRERMGTIVSGAAHSTPKMQRSASVPSSSPYWATARQRAAAWGLGASAIVLLTLGFAAGPIVGYVARRQKARNQWPWITAYVASAFVVALGFAIGFPFLALSLVFMLINMAVGAAHVFYATEKLVRRIEHQQASRTTEVRKRLSMAQSDTRRQLREVARRIVAEDPVKARELRIGRPDLRRSYDDGGLMDVNAAPMVYLMTIPGMTRQVAEQIVEWRRENGPFHSTAEVMVHTNLSFEAAERIDPFALYPTD
ncbi:MAG TPA: helix-hairpin-helix domain-containing protein [Candidatus Stackebrandtia excrementipullorum]|nr:helix-hairpin-helix domain-containing protein [Candidatus Stackebrandtia excrementipullorum]